MNDANSPKDQSLPIRVLQCLLLLNSAMSIKVTVTGNICPLLQPWLTP